VQAGEIALDANSLSWWGYVDLNHGPLPYQGAGPGAWEATVSL
jgi:hypothetical protein